MTEAFGGSLDQCCEILKLDFSSSELAQMASDLENKAEIIRECINGKMWQRAYSMAKDLTRGLERIVESV